MKIVSAEQLLETPGATAGLSSSAVVYRRECLIHCWASQQWHPEGDYVDMLGKIPSPARRVKGGVIKNIPLGGDDLKQGTHFLIE